MCPEGHPRVVLHHQKFNRQALKGGIGVLGSLNSCKSRPESQGGIPHEISKKAPSAYILLMVLFLEIRQTHQLRCW